MAFPIQTAKKVGIFICLGLIPVIALLFGILFGFPLVPSAIVSIFVALFFVIISYKMTDSPFIRMYEGRSFGVITLDSRGKIDFFDVQLQNGAFVGDYQGQKISVPFMQSFFFRINQFFGKGKAVEKENVLELYLHKDEFSKSLFKTDFPILIWDRQLNSFLTKEWLQNQEKKDMLIALGYETNKHIKEYNKTASGITRMIVDLIGSKVAGQSWVIWIVILGIVAFLLWMFWPQLSTIFGGTVNSATSALAKTPDIGLPSKLGG